MRNRKHVDISELYQLFLERKKCYFVCCDIKNMVSFNEIARKAGDLAIIETLDRMNAAAGPEDAVFRIGGDEFVLLTGSEDIDYAEEVAAKIGQHNGQEFSYEGQNIPLSLYVGVARFSNGSLQDDELFTNLHTAIQRSK